MTTLSWTHLFTNKSLLETTFITNLRTRIDEDTEDLITDIQIKAYIPQALEVISKKTKLIPEYMEAVYASEVYYTLPSDIGELGSIYMLVGENTPVFVPKTSLSGCNNFGYIRKGLRLYFYGITVGATLRIYASRVPTSPASNDNYIDLMPDFMECLYLSLELYYWKRRRSTEEIQNAYNLYKEAIQDARDNILDNYGESVSLYGKNT